MCIITIISTIFENKNNIIYKYSEFQISVRSGTDGCKKKLLNKKHSAQNKTYEGLNKKLVDKKPEPKVPAICPLPC